MSNLIGKNKWYILGSIGLVGVGVAVAFFFSSFRKIKNRNPKKLLFVGDSITTGQSAYPSIIQGERSDLTIDRVSSIGKQTSWMLDNLKNQLSSNKYDRVYIYGGINDSFSSVPVSTSLANIQEMVDLINQSGADAFVIQGYVIDGFMDYLKMPITQYVTTKEDYIPLIEKYKQLQASMSSTIKNANIIKPINLGDKTQDGIHPNGEGQQIIANQILKTL